MNKNKNTNKTTYNFLLCMNFILNNTDFTIENILTFLEDKFEIFLYKETILKYIRTMKFLGFHFKRKNNQVYSVIDFPFKMNLPLNCIKSIEKGFDYFNQYLLITDFKKLSSLYKKIQLLIPSFKNTYKNTHVLQSKMELVKEYCALNSSIYVILDKNKKKTKYLIEPFEVVLIQNDLYLKSYNVTLKTNSMLNISMIEVIEPSPLQNRHKPFEYKVLLKLKSELAQKYSLKPYEKIIKMDNDGFVIETICYDKTLFFNSILRYMQNSEILSPQSFRDDFKKYLNELYQIYDCPK